MTMSLTEYDIDNEWYS